MLDEIGAGHIHAVHARGGIQSRRLLERGQADLAARRIDAVEDIRFIAGVCLVDAHRLGIRWFLRAHADLGPQWPVARRPGAKGLASFAGDLPVAQIAARRIWRSHFDRHFNDSIWADRAGKRLALVFAQIIPTAKDQRIPGPDAGSGVAQFPGLGEGRARVEQRAIRHGHIGEEGGFVDALARPSAGIGIDRLSRRGGRRFCRLNGWLFGRFRRADLGRSGLVNRRGSGLRRHGGRFGGLRGWLRGWRGGWPGHRRAQQGHHRLDAVYSTVNGVQSVVTLLGAPVRPGQANL